MHILIIEINLSATFIYPDPIRKSTKKIKQLSIKGKHHTERGNSLDLAAITLGKDETNMGEVVDDAIEPLGFKEEVLAHSFCIYSAQYQPSPLFYLSHILYSVTVLVYQIPCVKHLLSIPL